MATAIDIVACNREKQTLQTATLLNKLVKAKNNGELNRFLRTLRKTDFLIYGKWDYIPLDEKEAQLLFQVIVGKYGKSSVIVTTNLEFSKWNEIFHDDKLTGFITD